MALTAERGDGRVDGFDEHALAVQLHPGVSKNLLASMGLPRAHLLAGLRVQQDPSQLNDLGGVLGHIHAMLVTRRSYVNDDVAVQITSLGRIGSHDAVHADPGTADGVAMGRRDGSGGWLVGSVGGVL